MTSELKVKSNRENASKSRGPKTLHGRRRSARNALHHGLTLSLHTNPSASAAVDSLARKIAGQDYDKPLTLARRVAEAELDVRRIRQVRDELISRLLTDPDFETRAGGQKRRDMLRHILNENFDVDLHDIMSVTTLNPSEKLAAILVNKERALRALDRYERRALSRRKFAVRAFCAARKVQELNGCEVAA